MPHVSDQIPIVLGMELVKSLVESYVVQRKIFSSFNAAFPCPDLIMVDHDVSAAFTLALILFGLVLGSGHNSYKIHRSFSSLDSSNKIKGQRRSLVCMLSRFELDNKIVTVLEPLSNAGISPDIALVIDDTTNFTTYDERVKPCYHPNKYQTYGEVSNYGNPSIS